MARVVYAHQYETVDALCHRIFGYTAAVTEQTLQANPGLSARGPSLAQGTPVVLPDEPRESPRKELLQLWD